MPRAETTKASAGSQPYQSPSYDNSPSSSSSATNVNATPTAAATAKAAGGAPKKKHVCPTCERAFTTSGHLARHSRVHTGERNHKCPFPGCETRCSRADNLQQHYRIHLSPGSRRSSARSRNATAAAAANSSTSNPSGSNPNAPPLTTVPAARRVPVRAASALSVSSASSSASGSVHEPGSSTDSTHSNSPPVSPPPLEQATMRTLYSTSPSSSSNGPLSLTALSHSSHHQSTSQYHSQSPQYHSPPDSPPPLTQATLPATAHHYDYEGSISRGTNSASPDDVTYSLGGPNMLQQGVALTNATATTQYGYRTVAAGGYQDDVSNGFGGAGNYGSSASSSSGSPSTSYAAGGDYQTTAPTSGLSGTSLHQIHTRHNSPANSMSSSRHSISHISSSALSYPPSPVSAQSVLSSSSVHQSSGPPTPTYPAMSYNDDSSAAYHYTSGQGLSQQQQQATMIHGSYPIHAGGRFDSPSPTLAPIQDGTRYTQQVANPNAYSSARRDSHHHPQLPNVMERHQQAHIYQPQPANVLGGEFGMGYQQQYAHAHAHSAWKDVGMRKGLGTLVG